MTPNARIGMARLILCTIGMIQRIGCRTKPPARINPLTQKRSFDGHSRFGVPASAGGASDLPAPENFDPDAPDLSSFPRSEENGGDVLPSPPVGERARVRGRLPVLLPPDPPCELLSLKISQPTC